MKPVSKNPAEAPPSSLQVGEGFAVEVGWTWQEARQDRLFRWPVVVLFCLLGGLVGWLASFIWPAPTRASLDLYVGFNPTLPPAPGTLPLSFTNIDDYKNWQMANLNSLVFREEILAGTLERLRQQDSSWESTETAQLAGMLQVYWRNAGRWRLSAEDRQPQRAEQAVRAWRIEILERVQPALVFSQQLVALNQEQQAISDLKASLAGQLALLENAHQQALAWREIVGRQPPEQVLGEVDRRQILALVGPLSLAQVDTDREFSESFPDPALPANAYLEWFDRLLPALEQEAHLCRVQIAALQQETLRLNLASLQAAEGSLGLAAMLTVTDFEECPDTPDCAPDGMHPAVTLVLLRPTSELLGLGSLLGGLLWAALWLARLGWRPLAPGSSEQAEGRAGSENA